jgi:endonuclease I
MRLLLISFIVLFTIAVTAQIPAYYNNMTLTETGTNLKNILATKISTGATTPSYTPGVWNALKQADLVTPGSSKVLLIYGYNDNDGDYRTDRTRGKNLNTGYQGQWNREHVYPKSLGNPNLGTSGPGADVHSLRACDGSRNSTRNNRKFGVGSGTASYINSNGNWYPGDEFKGDVARMMMYMYLRYGNQCLPKNVGQGTPTATDANMITLFLQWNIEDPVSAFELRRNDIVQGIQGNRNPFIDNPVFATQIWGGNPAEDRFGTFANNDVTLTINFDDYPEETSWEIKTDNGVVVYTGGNYGVQQANSTINITKKLRDGCYKLVFKDSYGDGMCCSYGNGSYDLYDDRNNSLLVSGGNFNYQRTDNFCISGGRFAAANVETVEEVAEEKEALEVVLYPNPVQGQLNLALDNPRALDYTITNQVGQVLATGRVQNQQIDVMNLPKGMYLLLLNDGEERITKTFVKQ